MSHMSSGWPVRFIGASWVMILRVASQSAVHGVSTRPGAMALTRTSGPRVWANRRVRWLRAAFDAAYGIELPIGRMPAIDVTLTIDPLLCRRAGTAVRLGRQVPT